MRTVAYLRRSTDRQSASPESQLRDIQAYADAHGHSLVRTYEEVAITGASEIERRTALPELIAAVKDRHRDFDGIIVWKLDRLARNTAEYHRIMAILDRHKCVLLSVKDPSTRRETAADRVVSNVLADFAAYERELVGERVYAHHMTQHLAGRFTGQGIPFGYTWDREAGRFEPSDRADDLIHVYRTFVGANGSICATARCLNAEGVLSPRGGLWSHQVLSRMVRSAFYRRQLTYDGHRVDAAHLIPAVVPAELIAQADNLLTATREMHPRQIGSSHAYSGLVFCAQCGSRMNVDRAYHNNPPRVYYNYICRRRNDYQACDMGTLSEPNVDKLTGIALSRAFDALSAEIASHRPAPVQQPVKSTRERGKLESMRKRLVDLYLSGGVIDDGEFRRRIAEIDGRLDALKVPVQVTQTDRLSIVQAVRAFAEHWEGVSVEDKRAALLTMQARLVIQSAPRGGECGLELVTPLLNESVIVRGLSRGRWGVLVYPYQQR